MTAEDVLRVLDLLAEAGVLAWISGGWGIDALVGEETRLHDDLDLAIKAEDEGAAIEALGRQGYAMVGEEDWRPTRFALADPTGRRVDFHPLVFDRSGRATQANLEGLPPFEYPPEGFVDGRIDGRVVPCISANLQIRFHLGYEPADTDRRDMRTRAEQLGLPLPAPYGEAL